MSESARARSATAAPESSRWGVRSSGCLCEAAIGSYCTPEGDHLDRYVRAAQQGRIARETLKQAVGRLAVIAPQTIVPSTRSADREVKQPVNQVVRGLLQLVPTADRDVEAGE
jgi:hypothetical protein